MHIAIFFSLANSIDYFVEFWLPSLENRCLIVKKNNIDKRKKTHQNRQPIDNRLHDSLHNVIKSYWLLKNEVDTHKHLSNKQTNSRFTSIDSVRRCLRWIGKCLPGLFHHPLSLSLFLCCLAQNRTSNSQGINFRNWAKSHFDFDEPARSQIFNNI